MTKILVVGAGAIGGITAARLSQAGVNVAVLDNDAEHIQRLTNPGLHLQSPDGSTTTVPVNGYTGADQLPDRYDAALLTLKAPAIESVVTDLVSHTRIDALVSLGNGLIHDQVEELARHIPVIRGVVEWGATNHGPGVLEQTTDGPFILGGTSRSTQEAAERIAATLSQAWPVTIAADIQAHIWAKLLLNTTFSGLGTVLGATYADVIRVPEGRALALATWGEGLELTEMLALDLPNVAGISPYDLRGPGPLVEATLDTLMQRVGPTRSSMLQDIERGRRTEARWINGGVRRVADQLGGEVPCNAAIEGSIADFELGRTQPGPNSLTKLHSSLFESN